MYLILFITSFTSTYIPVLQSTKVWRHKNEISEIMGFVRIFWKNNVQGAYLPKMSISEQIVSEIVAQLCLENSIKTLLNFFGVGPPYVVSQQSVRWLKHGQPCLHHVHVLSAAFPGSHSLHLAFGSFCYPPSLLSSFIFSTDKSVWQELGCISMGAHGWRVQVYQPWGHNSV